MSFEAPYWLLLLIPIAVVGALVWRGTVAPSRGVPGAWQAVIAPELLPALARRSVGTGKNAVLWYFVILCLITLALARPVIGKPDLQDYGNVMGRILVLDMSGAADVTELRFLAERLLTLSPDIRTGIVAVADDAYSVVPLTTDRAYALRYLGVLSADMMPEQGRALHLGVARAEQTLRDAGALAQQVVVITGGEAAGAGPSLKGSDAARHVVLTGQSAEGWSNVAAALGANIVPDTDFEAMSEALRNDARRLVSDLPQARAFGLFQGFTLLACALWLLLFRRQATA